MRRLMLFALLMASIAVKAQTVMGSFKLPAEEKYITLDWDCSKTKFENRMNEQEWRAIKGEDWDEAKKDVLHDMVTDLNEKLNNTRFIAILPGSELKSSFTIYICPLTLDKNGKNVTAFVLKDGTGTEVGSAMLHGSGGRIGSLPNLVGDGYENAASKLAKIIKTHNSETKAKSNKGAKH